MVLNIRFEKKNMIRLDGYFYSFDEETDSVIQKTDDGTLAFAYPLDTPINREVLSLEHDGESFWTLEHSSGTPADGFLIKRWVISNFVMVLQQTFSFTTNATDTFESSAFTIEKYSSTLTIGTLGAFGINPDTTTELRLNYASDIFALIGPGTRMTVGPSTDDTALGLSETVTVTTTDSGPKDVTLSANLANKYDANDPIIFSNNLWFFNEHFLKSLNVGGLYKINNLDGAIKSRTQGGAFIGVDACAFHDVDNFTGALASFNNEYLIFIRTNSLLFIDVNDSNLITSLSAVQNNLSIDTTEVFTIFDLAIEGDTLFRLQNRFNINGTETTSTTFNYQLATFEPFPTAISLTAVPAILPADSGGSTSTVTAKVTDQYLLAFGGGSATLTFSTSGGGTGSGITPNTATSLPSTGIVVGTYTTGDAAGLVTISAEVNL